MINNKRIIVSMTSWKKRINNVTKVAYSLYNNSLKPDSIELNLSTDEFTNKENDLPEDLLLLKDTNVIKINWVKENTGVFKKFIPVLQKYDKEDYYLLSVDDDWLYDKEYIKVMINHLGNGFYYSLQNSQQVIGNSTIYRSIAFNKLFWESITEELIKVGISDYYITSFLKKFGFSQSSAIHFPLSKLAKTFNPVSPNSHNKNEKDGNGNYESSRVKLAYSITDKIINKIKV